MPSKRSLFIWTTPTQNIQIFRLKNGSFQGSLTFCKLPQAWGLPYHWPTSTILVQQTFDRIFWSEKRKQPFWKLIIVHNLKWHRATFAWGRNYHRVFNIHIFMTLDPIWQAIILAPWLGYQVTLPRCSPTTYLTIFRTNCPTNGSKPRFWCHKMLVSEIGCQEEHLRGDPAKL